MSSLSIALTGDLLLARPVGWLTTRDAAFAEVVERLRTADVTYGNLETTFFEPSMPGVEPMGWEAETPFHSDIAVADDLRALGFDVLGRANNHALDWGVASMRETSRLLDRAGLVHAGTGESAAAAQAPRIVTTTQGSVALVSVTTSPATPVAAAVDPLLGSPGRPGVGVLAVRRELVVPPTVMSTVEALLDFVPELDTAWMLDAANGGRREVLQTGFTPGPDLAEDYAMDEIEREAVLSSVRMAASTADHVVFAVHAHQGDQRPAEPRQFLRDLARQAVEAGADIVIITGPHTLGALEIIEGRPAFYGIGNMFWQIESTPLQPYLRTRPRALLEERFGRNYQPTAVEVQDFLIGDWANDAFLQAVVPTVTFSDGSVSHVEIAPVRLATRGPCEGVPGTPDPREASDIIGALAEASDRLGTSLDFREGVGHVRI